MFTNSIDVEIKKYAENNRTYNTSCMYPRNFRLCSFSIRGQSSKGGGHELLVKSDIGDTLNIGVVPNCSDPSYESDPSNKYSPHGLTHVINSIFLDPSNEFLTQAMNTEIPKQTLGLCFHVSK